MEDKQKKEIDIILKEVVDGKTLKDMTAREFIQYCLKLINGIKPYEFEVQKLSKYLNEFDIKFWKNNIDDEMKLDILRQVKAVEKYKI